MVSSVLGAEQLRQMEAVERGRGHSRAEYHLPGPHPPPLPGLTKTIRQHRLSCLPHAKHPCGYHCLSAASGYLHLTRTFFPRRSLQTTSIILAGATQSGGWVGGSRVRLFQASPRPRNPSLQVSQSQALKFPVTEPSVLPPTPRTRILPGPKSPVPGPRTPGSRASAPSRRLKALLQNSLASSPTDPRPWVAGSRQLSPTPSLSA